MAETKRIQCPKCGAILEVSNPGNEAVKRIVCPLCKTALKVKFRDPDKTQLHGDSGETQPPGGSGDATRIAKAAFLAVGGSEYPLRDGVNTVGRKSPTSDASLQIATDDRYMSRRNSRIEVSRLPDGRLRAVISNDGNKNPTTVNGMKLEDGDAIVLEDGYNIVMGNTTVVYKEKVSTPA